MDKGARAETAERTARIFVVDAFTGRRFAGNPAAVMPLERFEDDRTLQALATENNLSETAFLVPEADGFRIRWFTPTTEVALCGHATLASAAVVMERLDPSRSEVAFQSLSGLLLVRRSENGYVMDFPRRSPVPATATPELLRALGRPPHELLADAVDYLAVLRDEKDVREFRPNREAIVALDRAGLILTAPGRSPYDFVSRYFAPAKGILEDPVTGSAHCLLTPYWASRLGKSRLRARQASERGGDLECTLEGERVLLAGSCVFYSEGTASF